jgi:hypothetical protein
MTFHQCDFSKFQANSNENATLSKGILKKLDLGVFFIFPEF